MRKRFLALLFAMTLTLTRAEASEPVRATWYWLPGSPTSAFWHGRTDLPATMRWDYPGVALGRRWRPIEGYLGKRVCLVVSGLPDWADDEMKKLWVGRRACGVVVDALPGWGVDLWPAVFKKLAPLEVGVLMVDVEIVEGETWH